MFTLASVHSACKKSMCISCFTGAQLFRYQTRVKADWAVAADCAAHQ